MQATEAIRTAIQNELDPIEQEEARLLKRLDELAVAKTPLQAALKALDTTKKPKSKAGKRSKPSPKQKDVREAALGIISENPQVTQSELEELTKDKLTGDLGFDLKGFEMRWKEVLASGDLPLSPTATNNALNPKPAQPRLID